MASGTARAARIRPAQLRENVLVARGPDGAPVAAAQHAIGRWLGDGDSAARSPLGTAYACFECGGGLTLTRAHERTAPRGSGSVAVRAYWSHAGGGGEACSRDGALHKQAKAVLRHAVQRGRVAFSVGCSHCGAQCEFGFGPSQSVREEFYFADPDTGDRFFADVAVLAKESGEESLAGVLEVLHSTVTTAKKAAFLERNGIPWVEVHAQDVVDAFSLLQHEGNLANVHVVRCHLGAPDPSKLPGASRVLCPPCRKTLREELTRLEDEVHEVGKAVELAEEVARLRKRKAALVAMLPLPKPASEYAAEAAALAREVAELERRVGDAEAASALLDRKAYLETQLSGLSNTLAPGELQQLLPRVSALESAVAAAQELERTRRQPDPNSQVQPFVSAPAPPRCAAKAGGAQQAPTIPDVAPAVRDALSCVFPSGQFEGKTVADVLHENLAYVDWCARSPDLSKALRRMASPCRVVVKALESSAALRAAFGFRDQ